MFYNELELRLKPFVIDKEIIQDMVTSYHEAGHVKYCLDFDIYFVYVTIIQENNSLGRVQGTDTSGEQIETDFSYSDNQNKEVFIMTFAGLVCEAKYSGEINLEGAYRDLADNLRELYIIDEKLALDSIDYIIQDIKNEKNWDKIKAIAEYLYKKKTATRSELLKLISDL